MEGKIYKEKIEGKSIEYIISYSLFNKFLGVQIVEIEIISCTVV